MSLAFWDEESLGRVWGAVLLNEGGGSPPGVALASDRCLWPLTLGSLSVSSLCQALSPMWWVLPEGVRWGIALYLL